MLTLAALAILSSLISVPVVCIDPGHPSEVGRGTRGAHVTEIEAAWNVAQELKKQLELNGLRVVMTKQSQEQYVTNRNRAEIANRANANFVVRLHCDASAGSGFTTYYPEQQGHTQGVTGPSPELLAREPQIAKAFSRRLGLELGGFLHDNGLKGDEDTAVGKKQGALTGSIFSKVPVVLVEMVVLTNPSDEAKISDRRGISKIATALAEATLSALNIEKPSQITPKS
jgi:N-acetylmuramoyl-L-alanine amidase